MGAHSSRCRADSAGADNDIFHWITVEIYDLANDHGGGLHVKDKVGGALARLQQNRCRPPTSASQNKSGMLDRDHVSSRFHIVDLEPTTCISRSRVLAVGSPVTRNELQICLLNRLPSGR